MQVIKQCFFGEAIYRLSVYEKGKYDPNKMWQKRNVLLLANSIDFMNELIHSISDENITPHDYEVVKKCLVKQKPFCFNALLLDQWAKTGYSLSSIKDLSAYKEINQLMSDIVARLDQILRHLNRQNRQEIWYLLQALHNLPRVYLRSEQESIFDSPVSFLSSEAVFECAQTYLKTIGNQPPDKSDS